MELEALRGMEQTLARYRPKIVLEIHRDVPRDEVLALLERCGYDTEPTPIDETLGAFLDPQSNANFVFLPGSSAGRSRRMAAKTSGFTAGDREGAREVLSSPQRGRQEVAGGVSPRDRNVTKG